MRDPVATARALVQRATHPNADPNEARASGLALAKLLAENPQILGAGPVAHGADVFDLITAIGAAAVAQKTGTKATDVFDLMQQFKPGRR